MKPYTWHSTPAVTMEAVNDIRNIRRLAYRLLIAVEDGDAATRQRVHRRLARLVADVSGPGDIGQKEDI